MHILLSRNEFYGTLNCMHNWDYQKTRDQNTDPVWYLERMLTYGLGEEKLDRALLERHFTEIKIPEDTRAFFELLLWNKPF